jgi:hypothetical protein
LCTHANSTPKRSQTQDTTRRTSTYSTTHQTNTPRGIEEVRQRCSGCPHLYTTRALQSHSNPSDSVRYLPRNYPPTPVSTPLGSYPCNPIPTTVPATNRMQNAHLPRTAPHHSTNDYNTNTNTNTNTHTHPQRRKERKSTQKSNKTKNPASTTKPPPFYPNAPTPSIAQTHETNPKVRQREPKRATRAQDVKTLQSGYPSRQRREKMLRQSRPSTRSRGTLPAWLAKGLGVELAKPHVI